MNSRHPYPRRVWKGGPELQSMTPLRGNPGNPGMSSKFGELAAIRSARALYRRSRVMFFDFLRDLSSKTLTFSITFEQEAPPLSAKFADVDDFYDACGLACRSRVMFF